MAIQPLDERLKRMTPETIALLQAQGLGEFVDQIVEFKAESNRTEFYLSQFITNDPKMLSMKEKATKLALVDDPVLIQGPSGTGKELIAKALHHESRSGVFIPINCAGLPENLIESELFGHVRGSFTDAGKDKEGILESAHDGTVFLDEIGDLSCALQAKLLRAIQEKRIRRVGANEERPISCRFVSATHHELLSQVKASTFRNDLYWRISTFILETTPLAERTRDIQPIIESLDYDKRIPDVPLFCSKITNLAIDRGNVRVLQQLVRRWYVLGIMPGE